MAERGDRLQNQAPRTGDYQNKDPRSAGIDVLLMGGPLDGHHRSIGHAEPPQFLAAIPGDDGAGVVMKPPLDPPPTIGAYELTQERDGVGAYVYNWRTPVRPQAEDCEADHEHVHPDDPSYNGFRVTELWAFTGINPADDQEAVIQLPGLPLLAADRRRVESLMPLAEETARRLGVKIRLLHFTAFEVEREIG